jgi:hypothetical protein
MERKMMIKRRSIIEGAPEKINSKQMRVEKLLMIPLSLRSYQNS